MMSLCLRDSESEKRKGQGPSTDHMVQSSEGPGPGSCWQPLRLLVRP